MKTIHLNLAAKPYRDYRPVYLTVIAMGLITIVLLGYNVVTGYEYLTETEQTRNEIAAREKETADEHALAKQLEERIEKIDLRALDRRSRFVNAQIRERAFSFSSFLDDLEDTLPNDVRLLGLNPSVDDEGTVHLSLSCAARERGGMVDLLDRLYAADSFRNAFPQTEQVDNDGTVYFTVATEYLPELKKEEAK